MIQTVNILIFGATGMVGQGVLRECLQARVVTRVVAVGRQSTGLVHERWATYSKTHSGAFPPH